MTFEEFCDKVTKELDPFIEQHRAELLPDLLARYNEIDKVTGDYDLTKDALTQLALLYDNKPAATYYSSVIIKVIYNICHDPKNKLHTIPEDFIKHVSVLKGRTPLIFEDFWDEAFYSAIQSVLDTLIINWKKQFSNKNEGKVKLAVDTIEDFLNLLGLINKILPDVDYFYLKDTLSQANSMPDKEFAIKYLLNIFACVLKNNCTDPQNNIPDSNFEKYLDTLIVDTQLGFDKFLNRDKPGFTGFWNFVKEECIAFFRKQIEVFEKIPPTASGKNKKIEMAEKLLIWLHEIDLVVDSYEALYFHLKDIKVLYDSDSTIQYLPGKVLSVVHSVCDDPANVARFSIPDEFKKAAAMVARSPRSLGSPLILTRVPHSELKEPAKPKQEPKEEPFTVGHAVRDELPACPAATQFFVNFPLLMDSGSSEQDSSINASDEEDEATRKDLDEVFEKESMKPAAATDYVDFIKFGQPGENKDVKLKVSYAEKNDPARNLTPKNVM